jgi:hypothetical protein
MSAAEVDELEKLLAKCRLEHLAPLLRAEEVDLDALQLFEEKDLADFGLKKGPRIKLLRALQGVFPVKPDTVPTDPSEICGRIESLGESLGGRLDALRQRVEEAEANPYASIERLDALRQRLEEAEEQLRTMSQDLTEVAERQRAAEARVAQLETEYESDPEEDVHNKSAAMRKLSDTGTPNPDVIWERVRDLSSSVQVLQELAPSRLCWAIRRITEKVASSSPGKCLRAPSFALCGSIVGMKLEFYPCGRGRPPDPTDERTLPEITPREHPALKDVRRVMKPPPLPDEGVCSIGICCPMGVKLQYHLQVGQTVILESQHAQWTTVFHDIRLRWRGEIEEDDCLNIVITAVRIHNKRLRIEGDTLFVQSD